MEKKPRKTRTPITPQFKEKVVRDHHDGNMSFLQLSHKYKCCFHTAKTICERNEYGFWNNPAGLAKRTMKHFCPVSDKRKELTAHERIKELLNDAIEVLELTLQQMKNRLKVDICDLSISQLAAIVAVIAPYTITKKDGTSKKKEETKEPSIFDSGMFKKV